MLTASIQPPPQLINNIQVEIMDAKCCIVLRCLLFQ